MREDERIKGIKIWKESRKYSLNFERTKERNDRRKKKAQKKKGGKNRKEETKREK